MAQRMSRRDYAVSLGLAKPGRGRMSKPAHDAISKAIADGTVIFTDVSVPVNTKPNSEPVKSEELSKSNSAEDFFGATPEPVFNGGWYYLDGDKRVKIASGKEVCRTCGYSLDYQRCSNPTYPAPNGEMMAVVR